MISFCKSKQIFTTHLLDNLDAVRKLRNSIHIGGLKTIAKKYSQKDTGLIDEVLAETIKSVTQPKK